LIFTHWFTLWWTATLLVQLNLFTHENTASLSHPISPFKGNVRNFLFICWIVTFRIWQANQLVACSQQSFIHASFPKATKGSCQLDLIRHKNSNLTYVNYLLPHQTALNERKIGVKIQVGSNIQESFVNWIWLPYLLARLQNNIDHVESHWGTWKMWMPWSQNR